MLRHYTDEVGKAAIMDSRYIMPGSDGRLYLTPDHFESRHEAQQKLSLARTPTGFFEVPEELAGDLSDPAVVLPKYGHPGGGREHYVGRPIQALALNWIELDA